MDLSPSRNSKKNLRNTSFKKIFKSIFGNRFLPMVKTKNILRFNNLKYNGPLLNGVQFLGLGTIIFIVQWFLSFLYFYDDVFSETDDTMKRYQTFVFRRFFYFGFLFSIVFPILYLKTKKDFCRFIILMFKNLM